MNDNDKGPVYATGPFQAMVAKYVADKMTASPALKKYNRALAMARERTVLLLAKAARLRAELAEALKDE